MNSEVWFLLTKNALNREHLGILQVHGIVFEYWSF